MFEVRNLNIKIKDRYLVKDVSFTLNKGDKLAIIGEEGNGKSTVLKSILGICTYAQITGNINLKGNTIGYLEQSLEEKDLKKKVFDFLFSNVSYYEKVNILYKNLELFQIKDTILEQEMHTLSGGERVKIAILKLIMEDCAILFLDEPTNDLDIQTLHWLERFIHETNKPILYVSHDETLLEKTATMILHLEQIQKKTDCRCTLAHMDYATYAKERLKKVTKQIQISQYEKRAFHKEQEKLQKIMQKVEYRQNTISRKDPHGAAVLKKKMHTLKSQEKKLNKQSLTAMPDIEENIHFFFESIQIPKTKCILNLDIPKLQVQDKILLENIHLEVLSGMHICIVGKNGVGKTTLIKKIYETLQEKQDIKVGYMPQNYEDVLKQDVYVLDFLVPSGRDEDRTRARLYLGNMNFTKEEMVSKIENLSNGTKAKLLLMKFVIDACPVLLLDEPTRNVSPLSNPVIRRVLRDFQGTIISVSHDRKYIEEVIDTVYVLTEEGLQKEK